MGALADNETIIRFLHVLSGIVWIGMLYFFNLVNLPLLKLQLKKPYEANMAEKVTGHVAIKTLFWFRWGAAFTLLFGLLLIEIIRQGYSDIGLGLGDYFLERGYAGYSILMGIVFALVMAFNVWFVIWPNQKVILGNNKKIAGGVPDDEKAKLEADNAPRLKTAVMASRINTWLSVPMLWGMVFGAHGYPGEDSLRGWSSPILVLVVVLLMMALYSKAPPAKKAA